MMGSKILTHSQLRLLRQAVDAAADWRTELMDTPSEEEDERQQDDMLAKFDARISATYEALKIVRHQQAHLRNLARAKKEKAK